MDISLIMSVPVPRDIITRSASPMAASHAPIDSRRMHESPILTEAHVSRTGIINTMLSIIPSSISRDINRCDCCIINATSIIIGTKCRIVIELIIDLRSEPIFDLQGRCFTLAFKSQIAPIE